MENSLGVFAAPGRAEIFLSGGGYVTVWCAGEAVALSSPAWPLCRLAAWMVYLGWPCPGFDVALAGARLNAGA